MKKRGNLKKKRTKFWYIQSCGTYTSDIPVFVGYTVKEITQIVKKQNWKKEPKDAWIKNYDEDNLVFDESKTGGVWFSQGYAILWLREFKNDWTSYETIMHECFHLVVNLLGKSKMMINNSNGVVEEEAMAYQQEFLFREIRRKLQNAFSIKR